MPTAWALQQQQQLVGWSLGSQSSSSEAVPSLSTASPSRHSLPRRRPRRRSALRSVPGGTEFGSRGDPFRVWPPGPASMMTNIRLAPGRLALGRWADGVSGWLGPGLLRPVPPAFLARAPWRCEDQGTRLGLAVVAGPASWTSRSGLPQRFEHMASLPEAGA